MRGRWRSAWLSTPASSTNAPSRRVGVQPRARAPLTGPRGDAPALEEGTQGAWIYEILSPHAEEVIVTMIPEGRGQKSDESDAFRLAEQLPMGAIKRHVFKDVGEYGTLRELARTHAIVVEDVVRVQNRIEALLRSRGLRLRARASARSRAARSVCRSARHQLGSGSPPSAATTVARPRRRAEGTSRRGRAPRATSSSPVCTSPPPATMAARCAGTTCAASLIAGWWGRRWSLIEVRCATSSATGTSRRPSATRTSGPT